MVQKIITFNVALKSTERQWVQKIPEVYTNDLGSVSIKFNITDCTDTELTGSSAIVLLKMRDGSFFQGPSADVSRTLNVFSYTLKENEGNHDGLAEIQLIVTIAGKEFATQKYQFKVNSGLDSEVAREIMIYDWTTLTAEARAYIDQFTADEMVRDAEFDNNEFDRNTDFVASQDARTLAFGTEQTNRGTAFTAEQTNRGTAFTAEQNERTTEFNESESDRTVAESGRVTAEANRVTAESGRVTAESGRVTKETQRDTAESNRVTAESGRVTAESGRVTAESGRVTAETNRAAAFTAFNTRLTAEETATATNKISAVKSKTFADVDARLEDVELDTTLMATNVITNGDFSNGTAGYTAGAATISASNNTLTITGNGTFAQPYINKNVNIAGTKKLYVRLMAKVTNSQCTAIGLQIYNGSVNYTPVTLSNPSANVRYTISTIYRSTFSGFPNICPLSAYPDAATANGKVTELQYIVAIDLTTTFGAGKEPTVEQMDAIMAKFENSWFDGTKNLFRANETLNKLMAVDARTEFEAKNLVVNGDFSNGTVGWASANTNHSVANNTLISTADGTSMYPQAYSILGLSVVGDKYYLGLKGRVTNSVCTKLRFYYGGVSLDQLTPVINTWYQLSGVITAITTNGTPSIFHQYVDATTAAEKTMEIKYVSVINLTKTFGAGKEPTLAEMDRLMARFPNRWFDGVKPIQTIETLYQEKANKVQEAWITPTLINGAVQHTTRPFQYRRTTYNSLQFRGEVSNCPINNGYITILADGYRPASNAYAVGNRGNTFSVVSVLTNGAISMTGTNVTFALFDNIEIPLD